MNNQLFKIKELESKKLFYETLFIYNEYFEDFSQFENIDQHDLTLFLKFLKRLRKMSNKLESLHSHLILQLENEILNEIKNNIDYNIIFKYLKKLNFEIRFLINEFELQIIPKKKKPFKDYLSNYTPFFLIFIFLIWKIIKDLFYK